MENVSGIAGMSVQHLSEIESSKRDPRLSSIERIADAMELVVMLVPEHMAPDIRRYIASLKGGIPKFIRARSYCRVFALVNSFGYPFWSIPRLR